MENKRNFSQILTPILPIQSLTPLPIFFDKIGLTNKGQNILAVSLCWKDFLLLYSYTSVVSHGGGATGTLGC